jgi:branched-chain amino acid transport system ATP-binding protein
MTTPLLTVENIHTGYGEVQVLRGVSIQLWDNERIGLFGPNGHGKTTLLRTISGLSKPWSGQIRFEDEIISGLSPRAVVDHGIIHIPQSSTLFPRMTVMENLSLGAYSHKAWGKRRENLEKVFELFPRLKDRRGQMCRTLSGGERQMLAVGFGLMGNGRLLMLDEPTLGLAPKIKEELCEAILKIGLSGIPLIIVEQDVEFLLSLTDRLYLIEDGRVVLEKTKETEELQHSQILEMYFGAGSITDTSQDAPRRVN